MYQHSPGPLGGVENRATGFGYQLLPRVLANVNAWKTMFHPYRDIWRYIKKKLIEQERQEAVRVIQNCMEIRKTLTNSEIDIFV